MKTNPDQMIHSFNSTETGQSNYTGLTKREYFTAMAMQGMLANSDGAMNENNMRVYSPSSISHLAILHAEALIEQLNK